MGLGFLDDWSGELGFDDLLVFVELLARYNWKGHHFTENVVFVEFRLVMKLVFNLVGVGAQAG